MGSKYGYTLHCQAERRSSAEKRAITKLAQTALSILDQTDAPLLLCDAISLRTTQMHMVMDVTYERLNRPNHGLKEGVAIHKYNRAVMRFIEFSLVGRASRSTVNLTAMAPG